MEACKPSIRPDGETGRHSGLKIRRRLRGRVRVRFPSRAPRPRAVGSPVHAIALWSTSPACLSVFLDGCRAPCMRRRGGMAVLWLSRRAPHPPPLRRPSVPSLRFPLSAASLACACARAAGMATRQDSSSCPSSCAETWSNGGKPWGWPWPAHGCRRGPCPRQQALRISVPPWQMPRGKPGARPLEDHPGQGMTSASRSSQRASTARITAASPEV